MRSFLAVALALASLAPAGATRPSPDAEPLALARILAARYPQEVSVRYIPALLWSGGLRLSALTGEDRWEEKAQREMGPFLSGATPSIAEPYVLTSLAGHLAFSDLHTTRKNPAAAALARLAADFILPRAPGELVRFPRGWTDDMFMASSLWTRVAAQTGDRRYADAAEDLLTVYAAKLQRADGVFVHAAEGPHAWGRGNGFAALGIVDALTYLPDSTRRAELLDVYRRHMRAMLVHQTADGAWRQVVDDGSAYRELTVTAMTVTALARGVRRGWLDRAVGPAIERGWRAVAARIAADGTLRDVCPSTGAGATRGHYLTRPAFNGADDRGAAMALLAALEMHEFRRMP